MTIESLDPTILAMAGDAEPTVEIAAGGPSEVRFDAAAQGDRPGAHPDARDHRAARTTRSKTCIPVDVLVSPETVAAYGEATTGGAQETLALPQDVVPGFGGLRVELSSTAMVGLGEGARYLIEYPYGCAEQRASRALGADARGRSRRGVLAARHRRREGEDRSSQTNLNELETFQCGDGGFAFWPGECWSASPYLTSYVAARLPARRATLGYTVDADVCDRGVRLPR